MFEGPWGLWGLFLWSASDIALVSVAVVFTGGATSDVFFVYALTTVFFGASYPARAQVVLLAFTFASYLSVLAAVDPVFPAGILFPLGGTPDPCRPGELPVRRAIPADRGAERGSRGGAAVGLSGYPRLPGPTARCRSIRNGWSMWGCERRGNSSWTR